MFVVPALVHYLFAVKYDSSKPVTVKGVVTKLAWVNPHAYVFLDVTDENGKVTAWSFECLSPNALARQGWNRNSLKPGDMVTVDGYMAKDNKPLADGSTRTLLSRWPMARKCFRVHPRTMGNGSSSLSRGLRAVLAVLVLAPASAQTRPPVTARTGKRRGWSPAPHTKDGKADLSGVWDPGFSFSTRWARFLCNRGRRRYFQLG